MIAIWSLVGVGTALLIAVIILIAMVRRQAKKGRW